MSSTEFYGLLLSKIKRARDGFNASHLILLLAAVLYVKTKVCVKIIHLIGDYYILKY